MHLKQNLVDQVDTVLAYISAPEGKSSLLNITDSVIIRIGESVVLSEKLWFLNVSSDDFMVL